MSLKDCETKLSNNDFNCPSCDVNHLIPSPQKSPQGIKRIFVWIEQQRMILDSHQVHMKYLMLWVYQFLFDTPQRPRIDLDKRFLPS